MCCAQSPAWTTAETITVAALIAPKPNRTIIAAAPVAKVGENMQTEHYAPQSRWLHRLYRTLSRPKRVLCLSGLGDKRRCAPMNQRRRTVGYRHSVGAFRPAISALNPVSETADRVVTAKFSSNPSQINLNPAAISPGAV